MSKTLPEPNCPVCGGIGTAIFCIVEALLMIAASVLLTVREKYPCRNN